ncbi:tetratricopeptide repeat-containing S1 family peptidase [Lyngbya confervoides]|uniref:Tetratricopeptide repeat-containing serine protease family protein n=1 Tax=Lyngbya confervoides BDU141951 TaxID=1574623 RepID=A0ABD4SZS1_9CYAN|nr:tetratricopeptide repeat-containing serine protease family protein [Lyngbya confervoides]MCM1981773.1 tetratricopeptide repeat-containing serine protease family protein [Lyngbya confervoides BDU141951]
MKLPQLLSVCLSTALTVVLTPALAWALSPTEVNEIAKNITVRIHSQSPGSGVMIRRDRNTYTVLTAAHVVATTDSYQVITRDGREHEISLNSIQKFPGLDLALLSFDSSQTYATAKLGDPQQVLEGSPSFVAGFPVRTQAITDILYTFTTGTITAHASRPLADGYALVYSNNTLPGMSGGPVLNNAGELLGIHGRADTTTEVQNENVNPDIFIKTGFNLGIPLPASLDHSVASAPPPPLPVARADDFYLEALQAYRQGNTPETLRLSSQAIAKNAGFAPAYSIRGAARWVSQDLNGALKDFDQALQLDPNLGQAHMGRALVQSALGNRQGALASYTQAIRLQGNHAILYYNRGIVYYNEGLKQEALEDLQTSADLALQANQPVDYQRALEAIRIASRDCRQSIRSLCDR